MKKNICIFINMACFISIAYMQAAEYKKTNVPTGSKSTQSKTSQKSTFENRVRQIEQDIFNWIANAAGKSFYHAANKKLSPIEKDIETVVRDFRNSKIRDKKLEARIRNLKKTWYDLEIFDTARLDWHNDGNLKVIETSDIVAALKSKKITIKQYINFVENRAALITLFFEDKCLIPKWNYVEELKEIEAGFIINGISYQNTLDKNTINEIRNDLKKECKRK